MAENSEISWTDHTFNPWMGCTKVSEACKFCYAERDMDHRYGKVQWGPSGTRVLTSDGNWRKPVSWNKKAAKEGRRMRVFCASLADIFEDWSGPIVNHQEKEPLRYCANCDIIGWEPVFVRQLSPAKTTEHCDTCGAHRRLATMQDVRERLFRLIDATPNLDWLLLTKRPENVWRMWSLTESASDCDPGAGKRDCHRPNVWLGTSVETQERAVERIPELLKCRDLARVLFLSCEPLLGPLNLYPWLFSDYDHAAMDRILLTPIEGFKHAKVDWVIAGGESGPTARPSNPQWFRDLAEQCETACRPFHFKQWGEYDATGKRVGKKAAGRELDGRVWDEFPHCSESELTA